MKEYLSDEIIGHISRDFTGIAGREKPSKKVKEPTKSIKRGRPANDEKREPFLPKRLDRQVDSSEEEATRELPTCCDRGTKKNTKG